MLSISATDEWRQVHAGGQIGLLELSGVTNRRPSPVLDSRKRALELQLRAAYKTFSRDDLLGLPVLAAYREYYKQFKKTYHAQLQLESIVHKSRDLPTVSPLVDANFLAEMTTLVLTAGHDVDRLAPPISIDVSYEGETIDQMGGGTKAIRPADMVMRDKQGICCSIIYGQDSRSPISPQTTHVLYVAYAPSGVSEDAVSKQLASIETNVRLFSPTAMLEQQRLIQAS